MKGREKAIPFIIFLIAVVLFRATQNAVQTTYAPLGQKVLHLLPSLTGFAITLTGIVGLTANLLLVSRFKPQHLRRVAITGLVALSLGILLVVLENSMPTYMISALLFGITASFMRTGLATLAGKIPGVPNDRGLAAYSVALSASLVIGPSAESVIIKANHDSLSSTLLAFSPLPLLASVLLWFLPIRTLKPSETTHITTSRAHLRENPSLRLAITGQMLYQIPFIAVTAFGLLLSNQMYGTSLATAQLSFTIFFSLSFITRLSLVWRPPRERAKIFIQLAGLLTLAGLLILNVGHNIIFLILGMSLLGIPHGLMFPLSISLIARGTNPVDIPTANATLFATTSIISVVSPTVLGLVISNFGYHAMLLLLIVPVVILTFVLFRSGNSSNTKSRTERSDSRILKSPVQNSLTRFTRRSINKTHKEL